MPSLLTTIIGLYGLKLYLYSQLSYYIHQRYIVFTVTASIILIIVGLLSFLLAPRRKVGMRKNIVLYFPLLLFLIAAAVPAKSLTSSSIDQRSVTGTIAVPQNISSNEPDFDHTEEWPIQDWWYATTIVNSDPNHYVDKPVKITGFVSRPKSSPERALYLARFYLMCCAIDAQPVGFWVDETDFPNLANDTWIEVSGTFDITKLRDSEVMVIKPTKIEKVKEPEDPYVY